VTDLLAFFRDALRLRPSRTEISSKITTSEAVDHIRFYFIATCIFLQAASHSRQTFAHSIMCWSSANFSHSIAHWLQTFSHAMHRSWLMLLWREQSSAAARQTVAQSLQECIDLACSFLPSVNNIAQCVKQDEQTSAHFEQALAQASNSPSTCSWALAQT
jgi:hypothetical protein